MSQNSLPAGMSCARLTGQGGRRGEQLKKKLYGARKPGRLPYAILDLNHAICRWSRTTASRQLRRAVSKVPQNPVVVTKAFISRGARSCGGS